MSYEDCAECGARWHSPCEPCAMDKRRNEMFAAYGIPTERVVIGTKSQEER